MKLLIVTFVLVMSYATGRSESIKYSCGKERTTPKTFHHIKALAEDAKDSLTDWSEDTELPDDEVKRGKKLKSGQAKEVTLGNICHEIFRSNKALKAAKKSEYGCFDREYEGRLIVLCKFA